MRRSVHISVLLLLYLLFTAKSCENQDDEISKNAKISHIQDSIKSTFESETLSNASMQAFEAAAKIRLADFSDYLAVVDDTLAAEPFRDKAKEMIRGLFISENSVLRFANPGKLGRRDVTVKQLLASDGRSSEKFGRIITDSIRVTQSLERVGDSMYTGKLSYSYSPAGHEHAKNPGQALPDGTVDFLVTKHEKKFGTDNLMIWEVFLGNTE